jgi:hypothetical protein
MTLKSVVDTLDGVPEPARELYAEKDGKFHLQIDGMVPKARLDEFRQNNIDLQKKFEAFDGIDPVKARELAVQAAKIREGELIAAGKVDELLSERTNAMRQEYDAKLQAEQAARAATSRQLDAYLIDGGIQAAALKAGVKPSAMEDVLLRGRQVFRVEEGKVVAKAGDKEIFGKSGEALTFGEWLVDLQKPAAHLFEPSQGTGAQGSQSGGAAKTMTRKQFDALAPGEKAKVARERTVAIVD